MPLARLCHCQNRGPARSYSCQLTKKSERLPASGLPLSEKETMAERIATRGLGTMPSRDAADNRQSRRMLAALVVLVIALGVTVLRDRDDLFGNDTTSDQAQPVAAAAVAAAPALTAVTPAQAPQTAPAATQRIPAVSTPAAHASAPAAPAPAKSRPVRTFKAQVIHHESPANAVVTSAAQRAQLTADVPPAQTTAANYPLLDASTRVQGSVVLQALIGADGSIQDLRVVTGPAILGSAARQAVLGWRFKPYMENGHAVETQATITVNFTIKVADNSNKTARSYTPDKVIVLADNT